MSQQKRTLPAGTILFCAPNDDGGIKEAQSYARFHKFTKECVKIKTNKESVFVQAIVPVETMVAIMEEGSFSDHQEKEN